MGKIIDVNPPLTGIGMNAQIVIGMTAVTVPGLNAEIVIGMNIIIDGYIGIVTMIVVFMRRLR